ncbi:hypothetical protein PHYSODRAFT_499297 [Phytophthora sojae]|uniref:Uncharacterized protein n=1 Tax=Phytophthora sojae (strain P6497) TaxID=1094619 RepID=G4ZHL4_PHYSP|nr:hypothetical protein PHYSODRAFT_499297 [Phytophthora sojae]EGZ18669.1 hypothetical protein PHYSODRAFT_499297 [Phytophthora sojae]|eukprot:XP_009527727.1 hypothetical protein PHYSODRAFT_499297 [Phytophthora sojae]
MSVKSFKLPPEAIASPVGGENIDLRGLWEYSQLGMLQLSLPSTLSLYLERPLPFRVCINNRHTAAKIFAEDGPEISCDALSSLIDVLVMSFEVGLDEEDTKQSCQKLDDLLFAFTGQISRANGVQLKVERKDPTDDGSTGKSLRSDLTVFCDGCLVLCGEEREGVADMNDTIAEPQSKMTCWDPQFFGELPYILGYVACGNRRKLFAFRFNHFYSICEVSTTMAIKLFYNLVFLLSYMAVKSKWTRPSRLSVQTLPK